MTVAELIEWLKTKDQGAAVKVLVGRSEPWNDIYSFTDFDPSEHSEYLDMRGNPFAKGTPFENDRDLLIGREAC